MISSPSVVALGTAILLLLAPAAGPPGPVTGPGPAHSPVIVGAAPGLRPGPVGPALGWNWPLDPRPELLRVFNPPAKPWLSGHRGVDLAASREGAPVLAPAAGTVSFAGIVVDRPVVTVDHGDGLRSSFEAVRSTLSAGARVGAGDVLGWIQAGHCLPAPCIHWGVRQGETYLNPLAFVTDLRPSVLLPPLDPAPG